MGRSGHYNCSHSPPGEAHLLRRQLEAQFVVCDSPSGHGSQQWTSLGGCTLAANGTCNRSKPCRAPNTPNPMQDSHNSSWCRLQSICCGLNHDLPWLYPFPGTRCRQMLQETSCARARVSFCQLLRHFRALQPVLGHFEATHALDRFATNLQS